MTSVDRDEVVQAALVRYDEQTARAIGLKFKELVNEKGLPSDKATQHVAENAVQATAIDTDELLKEYLIEHDKETARNIVLEFQKLVDSGKHKPDKRTKEVAETIILNHNDSDSRPTDDYQRHNKTAYLHAEDVANTESDNLEEELKLDDTAYLDTVKEEINEIEDPVEETDWDGVRWELEQRLHTRLHEEDVHGKLREVINEHSRYEYNETEVYQFAEDVIDFVANQRAEQIRDKIVRRMNSDNLLEEETTVRNTVKETLYDDEFRQNVKKGAMQKLGKKGISRIASVIAIALTSGGLAF